jgi:hypothetical protein
VKCQSCLAGISNFYVLTLCFIKVSHFTFIGFERKCGIVRRKKRGRIKVLLDRNTAGLGSRMKDGVHFASPGSFLRILLCFLAQIMHAWSLSGGGSELLVT